MIRVLTALAGSGFLIASTVLAQAADPIKLRVADSFPKGHFIVKLILEPWMEQVSKRTNNAVTFEHYPAQQLGKAADMLKLTQTGVADIGYVAPGYTSEKMPVSEAAMLPGAFEHACQGTLAYWKLARNGVIAEQDYTANNIRLLLAVSLPQYRIFTVKQPVKDVPDVTGLKCRKAGKRHRCAPVLPEKYQALADVAGIGLQRFRRQPSFGAQMRQPTRHLQRDIVGGAGDRDGLSDGSWLGHLAVFRAVLGRGDSS